MSVTTDNILELLKQEVQFYVKCGSLIPFIGTSYEKEIEIMVGGKGELYWCYKGSSSYWRWVEIKYNCKHLFINNEVVYHKAFIKQFEKFMGERAVVKKSPPVLHNEELVSPYILKQLDITNYNRADLDSVKVIDKSNEGDPEDYMYLEPVHNDMYIIPVIFHYKRPGAIQNAINYVSDIISESSLSASVEGILKHIKNECNGL